MCFPPTKGFKLVYPAYFPMLQAGFHRRGVEASLSPVHSTKRRIHYDVHERFSRNEKSDSGIGGEGLPGLDDFFVTSASDVGEISMLTSCWAGGGQRIGDILGILPSRVLMWRGPITHAQTTVEPRSPWFNAINIRYNMLSILHLAPVKESQLPMRSNLLDSVLGTLFHEAPTG